MRIKSKRVLKNTLKIAEKNILIRYLAPCGGEIHFLSSLGAVLF
jgi:hypothetical protein